MIIKRADKYREYMKKYMLKRYHDRRNEAIKFLGGHCLKCGSDKNLQFDHKERKNKDFTIAKLSSINEKKFWKEIQKCQLLCNSCHSEKTLLEVGHISAKDSHGTLSSYRYCKCDLCKKAHSDYCRKWKKRKSLKNA